MSCTIILINSVTTSKKNPGTSFWLQVVEILDIVGERRFYGDVTGYTLAFRPIEQLMARFETPHH